MNTKCMTHVGITGQNVPMFSDQMFHISADGAVQFREKVFEGKLSNTCITHVKK